MSVIERHTNSFNRIEIIIRIAWFYFMHATTSDNFLFNVIIGCASLIQTLIFDCNVLHMISFTETLDVALNFGMLR